MEYIKESPDHIVFNREKLNYKSKGAYSIGYFNDTNKIIVTIENHPVYYMNSKNIKPIDFFYAYEDDEEIRDVIDKAFTFPGRMWVEQKLISFWRYPSQDKLDEFLRSVEKEYNTSSSDKIDFNDPEWKIEVISDGAQIYSGGDMQSDDLNSQERIIIPLKDYKGSKNFPEKEYTQHILSPLKKLRKEVANNQGSKKRFKDMKDKETMAQYRAKNFQESYIKDFKSFTESNNN